MKKLLKVAIILSLLLPFDLFSQVNFRPEKKWISLQNFRSTLSCGFSDINGDGWDDIIRLHEGKELEVLFRASNELISFPVHYDEKLLKANWTLSIGDIQNDGINEIAIAGVYTGASILEFNGSTFDLIQKTDQEFYAQASNFADINNDGWLDWFVCDDEGLSDIFLNDGSGTLVRNDTILNMHTIPISDNSGNYGSEWIDFDSDGDLDLYISKCKADAFEPTDPRRINMLFVNDGENHFEEKASQYGLNINEQSWASSFADFDNDGDFDLIVINHGDAHSLMENIENDTFIERSEAINHLSGTALQCVSRDFDNNGYIDVFITGDQSYMIYNMGDFEFLIEEAPLPDYIPSSFAVGDINRDGFLDIYASYSNGLVFGGFVDDILWVNGANQNNYISFHLRGTSSNINGIGTRIKLYGPFGSKIQELRAGESYGIMNSLNIHFGLGNYTEIDSMTVFWPSGMIDYHKSVQVNQFYQLTEGKCINTYRELEFDKTRFCTGDSVKLYATEDDVDRFLWSDKSSEASLIIRENQISGLQASDTNGCLHPYKPVVALKNPTNEKLAINIDPDQVACGNDTVTLSVISDNPVVWSDGVVSNERTLGNSGLLHAQSQGTCSILTDSIIVNLIDSENFEIYGDTIKPDETALIAGNVSALKWYYHPGDATPFHIGDSVEINGVSESRAFYVEHELVHQFENEIIGENTPLGDNPYSADGLNGKLFFTVLEDCTLESVEVYTDLPGIRVIQLRDELGSVIQEKEIVVDSGMNVLHLQFNLQMGNRYSLGTSADVNLINFGHVGPRFQRNFLNTKYPYEGNLIKIMNSSFGPAYYLYFFKWNLKPLDLNCVSDRRPVWVHVDFNSAISELSDQLLNIYPNPFNDELFIELSDKIENPVWNMSILNATGKVLEHELKIEKPISEMKFNTAHLASGLYIFKISSRGASKEYLFKMVKL